MRKLLSTLLAVAMLLTCTLTGSALEEDSSGAIKWKYNSEYDFTVAEHGDGYQTVRTYENKKPASTADVHSSQADSTSNQEFSAEKTKAILSSIGMEPEFIEELSQENLQDYANCKSIVGVTSYSKADADGNVISVPAEEGIKAMKSTPPGVSSPNYEQFGNTLEDSYMKLMFVVGDVGNGRYSFSVDARWLQVPFWRLKDSLGACAQNISVINDSRQGWYKYDYTHYTSLAVYSGTTRENLLYYETVSNGNWDGSAGVFDLKDDILNINQSTESMRYTNHKVHYQFKADVLYPSLETKFNTSATYCHTKINIFPDMSIQISTTGPGVSIGLLAVKEKDIRTVDLDHPIHYIPN